MADATLPTFLWSSPAGLHIRFFEHWVQSGLTAPISTVKEKSHWASESNALCISRMFCIEGPDPWAILGAKIFIYNKSRDIDRVCPSCFRWYRVGEIPKSYSSFEEFKARPVLAQPEAEPEVAAEQELSGICTRDCLKNRIREVMRCWGRTLTISLPKRWLP